MHSTPNNWIQMLRAYLLVFDRCTCRCFTEAMLSTALKNREARLNLDLAGKGKSYKEIVDRYVG
jgi:hypothetical protein